MAMERLETAFSIDTSSIKYGPGVTREVGFEMQRLGARRVMVVTDPNLSDGEAVSVALSSLRDEDLDAVLFDEVRVEPTDLSFKEAIEFATDGQTALVTAGNLLLNTNIPIAQITDAAGYIMAQADGVPHIART